MLRSLFRLRERRSEIVAMATVSNCDQREAKQSGRAGGRIASLFGRPVTGNRTPGDRPSDCPAQDVSVAASLDAILAAACIIPSAAEMT
ncbi:hypothetical protein GCM10007857_79150 [Bradyrhizobium iriomotense]|uniref:Uncharacterized protein n=1 Tax=Bradyrhizobium iriomotense TaxID=441950 RepID=A0ABQ6B9X2_9BRAD|nr:hypothetical protein GCM10007857_79150 [Bradyrhizobium iriomotense]